MFKLPLLFLAISNAATQSVCIWLGKILLDLMTFHADPKAFLSDPISYLLMLLFSVGALSLLKMMNNMISLYNQVDSIPTYITTFIMLNIFAIAFIMDDISLYT